MDGTLFTHHDVLQRILQYATNGAFTLNVAQQVNTPILTHAITNLRATCRDARAMIPAPTKLTPEQLLLTGAQIGDVAMCKYANARMSNTITICKALSKASAHGYSDIVGFVLSSHDNLNRLHMANCAGAAAQNGHLQICHAICEYDRTHNPMSWQREFVTNLIVQSIIRGAAKGHHLNVIRSMQYYYGIIDEIAQCEGAVAGNHPDLLNITDASNILHYIAIAADRQNESMCNHLRDLAKKCNILTGEFYHLMITNASFNGSIQIVEMALTWLAEDGIKLNYTKTLCCMIKMSIMFTDDIQQPIMTMCSKLHEARMRTHARINYDAIIRNLGDFARPAEYVIREWARADGFAITEAFDHDLYDPRDDVDDGTLFDIE